MTNKQTKKTQDDSDEEKVKDLVLDIGAPANNAKSNKEDENMDEVEQLDNKGESFELDGSVYNMIVVGDIWGNMFALAVAVIQCFLFVLFIEDLLATDKLPGNSTRLSAFQFLTIYLAVFTNDDLIKGIYLLTNINALRLHAIRVVATNLFRLLMGVFSLFISFRLIVTRPTVLSLVEGYAGSTFMSNLDELCFALAEMGFFTDNLKKNAIKVKKASFEDAPAKCRLLRRTLLLVTWILMVIPWAIFFHQQKIGAFLTSGVIIQFKYADIGNELVFHSGVYVKDKTKINSRFIYVEKESKSDDKTGVFAFCDKQGRWTLSITKRTDVADLDPCNDFTLRSSPSKEYAFELILPSGWVTRKGEDASLEQLLSTHCKSNNNCGGNGECDRMLKRCICNEGFSGFKCEYRESCPITQSVYGKAFSQNGAEFRALEFVDYKSRPVYASSVCFNNKYDVCNLMIFLGTRWAISQYISLTISDKTPATDIRKFFDKMRISYLSDPTSAVSPVGLRWNYVLSSTEDGFTGIEQVSSELTCRGCNETIGVGCDHGGQCINGECQCNNFNETRFVGNHCENPVLSGIITTTYYGEDANGDKYCGNCPPQLLNLNNYDWKTGYLTNIYLTNDDLSQELFINFDVNIWDSRYISSILFAQHGYSYDTGDPVMVNSTNTSCASLNEYTELNEYKCLVYPTHAYHGLLFLADIGYGTASKAGTLYFSYNGAEVVGDKFDTECDTIYQLTAHTCNVGYKSKLYLPRATIKYELTSYADSSNSFVR